jgi:glutathione S-transferase
MTQVLRIFGVSFQQARRQGDWLRLAALDRVDVLDAALNERVSAVGMDHPKHDLDAPAFRAINPFGQIPAIDDDGVIVTESGAILLYLARRSGKLMPRDLAGEAQVLR